MKNGKVNDRWGSWNLDGKDDEISDESDFDVVV